MSKENDKINNNDNNESTHNAHNSSVSSECKPSENTSQDDEISLIDLFAVLWHYKPLIISLTTFAMILAVVLSLVSKALPPEKSFMPNVYTPQAHMLIDDSKSSGGSLSSMLSGSLGGLAALAGVSGAAGATYSQLATYLVSSNPFLDAVIEHFNLLEKEAIKKSKTPQTTARKSVQKMITAEQDKESGVFTISCTNIDKEFARDVVNFTIDWLQNRFDELGVDKNKIQKQNLEKNIASSFSEIKRLQRESGNIASSVSSGYYGNNVPSIALQTTKVQMELSAQQEIYKQLKIQYEMLKVQMQSESPVFQIIERPELPEVKSKPSRGMLCIIVTFAAGFFSVFLAFLLNAIQNIKQDKVAMAKLKGINITQPAPATPTTPTNVQPVTYEEPAVQKPALQWQQPQWQPKDNKKSKKEKKAKKKQKVLFTPSPVSSDFDV